jgi:DNA polymerase III subunit gamma/tau
MGQALYRKYRSKSLSEVVGQGHITTALANAIKSGKISHAYLLTGPRGVGKTSIARILAYEVNGLPYDETATNLDIIEIDAASNRRIDEIRELRDRVQAAPAQAKYKVYIIDEVHMLTREAFNALLKTLEEPPAHAIFILATTEAHKLPETIVSRTQRFTFKPIERQAVIDHLRSIAKQEKIDVSDEALGLIADHGGGSFRDSISLLDQASNHASKLDVADIQAILGIAPDAAIAQLAEQLSTGTPQTLLALLKELREQGFNAAAIAKQLSQYLRSALLGGSSVLTHDQTLQLLEKLIAVPASTDPSLSLELALLGGLLTAQPALTPKSQVKETTIAQPPLTVSAPISKVKFAPQPPVVEVEPEPIEPTTHEHLDNDSWQAILTAVKQHHNTLYSVVRTAEPTFNNDELTLYFKFSFHQKRINEAKNKQTVSEICSKLLGRSITINCLLANKPTKPTPKPVVTKGAIDTISNIFGAAEVLES